MPGKLETLSSSSHRMHMYFIWFQTYVLFYGYKLQTKHQVNRINVWMYDVMETQEMPSVHTCYCRTLVENQFNTYKIISVNNAASKYLMRTPSNNHLMYEAYT